MRLGCMTLLVLHILAVPASAEELKLVYDNELIQSANKNYFFLEGTGGLIFDEPHLHALITELKDQIYSPPENARLSKTGELVPEIPGTEVDEKVLKQLLIKQLLARQTDQLKIPTRSVYPRVDSELLKQISTYLLGEFRTHFKQDHIERSHNIDLAVQAINNQVVFPGETFSFNEAVGERTEERGYKRAPVIVKGELAEGLGGGICQVSSTLFNAVDLRGIQIVERYSHSKSVPYVPPGRDAAVSWWGPDFAFKNIYHQPVLILAETKQGELHIRIFSSEHINNQETKQKQGNT